MNTFSCAAQVNGGIADEHGDGRDDLEVDEGFDAETAHFLQVGVPGNADNEDSEQQGRDDDLDEPEKDGAEELQVDRDRGPVLPKLRAGEKPDQDPTRQRAAGCGIGADEKDREPTQERWDDCVVRRHVSASQERRSNGGRGNENGSEEKSVFHWSSTRERIVGERYAASVCVSMDMEVHGRPWKAMEGHAEMSQVRK